MSATRTDLHQRSGNASKFSGSAAIDVGGHRLSMTCDGNGTPTVVLETGLGAESCEWEEVYQAIAPLTRVLRYDRAGRGASDPASGRRDALKMTSDLHKLLHLAGISGPYILVGHSFGGLLVRLFAHRYAESVAGLVLVDAMHEDQFNEFAPLFPPPTTSETPAMRDVRAFWSGGWRNSAATTEHIDLVASTDQARAIQSLNAIPVHVIVAGTFLNLPAVLPQQRAAMQQRWEDLQRRFLQLSANATYSIARSSGHFMQRDEPRAVIDVIRRTISTARGQATSALIGA